ncbi:hypothetical protein CMI37_18490 [Candidatus Pacearchaeota archaeon]|nr:hypothetical protein [Candidatus Pacearchaeota archaeon]|tara:strand:- start:7606 stop:7893 length:288 start_codon:yes stop_codon:yes gene_type:complete
MSKMGEVRRKILDVLFWIALIVGVVMIIWRIFGNSSSYVEVLAPFVVMSVLKIWAVNNELKDFKYQVRLSFDKVRNDMGRIENKIDGLNKLGGGK